MAGLRQIELTKEERILAMQATPVVACYSGPRGSGKTVAAVYELLLRLLSGKKVLSNIPIAFDFGFSSGRRQHFEAEPLSIESLYLLSKNLIGATVFIDELPLYFSNYDWNGAATKLISDVLTLIRHIGLSFVFTSQDSSWLPPKFRFQLDALVGCFDMYFADRSLERGTIFSLAFKDMSGYFTGTPWKESVNDFERQGDVYRTIFLGKNFWECYDSFRMYDPASAHEKLQMLKPKSLITFDSMGQAHYTSGGERQRSQEIAEHAVFGVKAQYEFAGQRYILSESLAATLQAAGCDIPLPHLGRLLKSVGFEYKHSGKVGQSGYILTSVPENGDKGVRDA